MFKQSAESSEDGTVDRLGNPVHFQVRPYFQAITVITITIMGSLRAASCGRPRIMTYGAFIPGVRLRRF